MKSFTLLLPLLSVTSVLSAAIASEPNQTVDVLPLVSPTPITGGSRAPSDGNSTLVEEGALDGDVDLLAAPTNNYAATCRNYGIVSLTHFPRLYRAECRSRSGSWGRSDLSLPKCLANSNGRLVEQNNGGYDLSCDVRSCQTSGTSITCNCKDYGGNWRSTSYNLNNVLANDDGVLRCYDNRGF
ncbi:Cyanovirin-N [Colletotrichum eremochloae]|nr:Cyanovirin-N [Colletotrichum eremochloae]